MTAKSHPGIWLDVGNVRVENKMLKVQFRADRHPEPRWWEMEAADPSAAASQFKAVSEALEKKRPVVAELVWDGAKGLKLNSFAIQYAETTR